jgi:hypothetical protein
MKTLILLKKPSYTGVKVTSLLKALQCRAISRHLLLSERDEISLISNAYREFQYVSASQMNTIWDYYWRFVLNDYRHSI